MEFNKKIRYGLSLKADGDMRIGGHDCEENRKKYIQKKGLDYIYAVSAGLNHGYNIKLIAGKDRGKIKKNTDALITNIPGIILTVTVADCLPIYIWNKEKIVFGLIHAGWRGILKNISGKTVDKINNIFRINFEDLKVFIGPHIKSCHFEVKAGLVKKFSEYPECVTIKQNRYYIDLEQITKKQLIKAGIKARNIKISPDCTYCRRKYFSFRRERPNILRDGMAWINIS